jgi:hypothetical protein
MTKKKKAVAKVRKPKTGRALRYNEGKAPVWYILHYPRAVEVLSRILEVGEVKYAKMNWKLGGNADEDYLGACMRHLFKFVNNPDPFDEEYGTNHLGHAIWNLMTLMELNGHPIMDSVKFNKAIRKLKRLKEKKKQ